MTVLFYCNTNMQLINAVNLKLTRYKNDVVDIIFSDHTNNSETVASRAQTCGLFRTVKFIKSKNYIYNSKGKDRIQDVVDLTVKRYGNFKNYIISEDYTCDELYYYNNDLILYAIYDLSIRNGVKPKCIRMEESLTTYGELSNIYGSTMKAINRIRKVLNQPGVISDTKTFACYCPELLKLREGEATIAIPALDRTNSKLLEILNYIFHYDPNLEDYHEKYIYFATSMDVDGHPVGETELVLDIAKKVGNNNILIKAHPRDKRTVFQDNGLRVLQASAVPWEIIQLNNSFSKNCFLSISSSSILNATAMLNDEIETYFLYPLVLGRNEYFDKMAKDEIQATLNKLHSRGRCTCIKTMADLDSL